MHWQSSRPPALLKGQPTRTGCPFFCSRADRIMPKCPALDTETWPFNVLAYKLVLPDRLTLHATLASHTIVTEDLLPHHAIATVFRRIRMEEPRPPAFAHPAHAARHRHGHRRLRGAGRLFPLL